VEGRQTVPVNFFICSRCTPHNFPKNHQYVLKPDPHWLMFAFQFEQEYCRNCSKIGAHFDICDLLFIYVANMYKMYEWPIKFLVT